MVSRRVIDEVLSQKTLALVGVSRNGTGFGNAIRKELAGKGYSVLLVHPEAETIADEPCDEPMRKSRFSEDEMVKILREANKAPAADARTAAAISGTPLTGLPAACGYSGMSSTACRGASSCPAPPRCRGTGSDRTSS